MKRGVLFFLLILISLGGIIFAVEENGTITGNAITGETVTGEATEGSVSLTVTVLAPVFLELLHPKNNTYFSSRNVPLNFTVRSQDAIWYSLDSEANITINNSVIKFNFSEGSHTIFLYGNNTYSGIVSRNVTFFVNSSKFNIKYNNYSNEGISTNFNASSYEDAQNITGVVLENEEYGKVNFGNNIINLTDDSNFSDNQLDLDSNTNISFNRIEINSAEIGNFNKSATLTLYNLTFTNPRVLRDGEICSSAICTEINYSGGIFNFNVTGFSVYTTEETPEEAGGDETPAGGGGGGGGGGGITIPRASVFSLSDEQISISISPGEIESKEITITNNRNQALNFQFQNTIQDFLIIPENSFSLAPNEKKTIALDFIARENAIPNLYLGKIIVSAGGETKEVLVAVEVETGGALLDVQAEIPRAYKRVLPGGELLTEIKMFNLGIKERADVFIDYEIRDFNNKTLLTQHESIAIETQTSFTKTFVIPEDAEYDDYILYVKATYDGKIASATANFEIVDQIITDREKIFILVIVLLVIFIGMIVYFMNSMKTDSERVKKVNLRSIIKRK